MTPLPAPDRALRAPHRGPSLARRALPAVVLTGASGLLLSSLDHPGSSVSAATGTTTDAVTQVGVVTPAPTATTSTVPVAAPATTPATPATTPATAAAPGTIAATPTTTAVVGATVTSTVPAAPACTTYDGPTVQTKWGPVEVEASVAANGSICSADAIVTPSDHRKSVDINERAVPVLDAAAISAQNASFDGVSGATITSNAYKSSLQAILDSVA